MTAPAPPPSGNPAWTAAADIVVAWRRGTRDPSLPASEIDDLIRRIAAALRAPGGSAPQGENDASRLRDRVPVPAVPLVDVQQPASSLTEGDAARRGDGTQWLIRRLVSALEDIGMLTHGGIMGTADARLAEIGTVAGTVLRGLPPADEFADAASVPPTSLPTRAQVANVLDDLPCWCGLNRRAHTHVTSHQYEGPGSLAAADAILALLAPGAEG